MAVATLIGAGLGVHLGRSAIGAVDPFYFTDPNGNDSYADLVPAASLSRPSGAVTELASADPAFAYECVGCDAHEILYERRYDAGIEQAWSPPEPAPVVEAVYEFAPVADVAIAPPVPVVGVERQQIERYAYYPVSAEAAAAHQATATTAVEAPRELIPVYRTAEIPRY